MKDKNRNHIEPEENFSDALKSVVKKIEVDASFKAELGKHLAEAHQPAKLDFGQFVSNRALPAFGWVFALALMALVLNWMFRSIAPPPIPAAQETASQATQDIPSPVPNDVTTPIPGGEGYDWRGAKLYLAQPLPQSPAEANIYLMNKDEPATVEEARSLARRFGIQGEMYTTDGFIYGTTDYVFSDGKQSLQVHSDKYFTYTADLARHNRSFPKPANPHAEKVIREFLSSRGFDFSFHIYPSEFFGGYVVQPLAPDSIPMQYESFTLPMMRVVLDENGQVLTIDASLMDFDPNPIGEYGILSAQEAFDRLLDDSAMIGKMEFSHSPTTMPREWYPIHPDNQPVTIYGYVLSSPAVDSSKPPLVLMDGVPVTGNSNGMESLDRSSFIEATGQFMVENGIRKFNVESWDRNVNEIWISGILSRQGDQVIFTSDDGTEKQYPLIDPPADLPIDAQPSGSSLAISGVIENGALIWDYIQFFENNSGGGGGGGGAKGFYQLNLSGAPVPFPTPSAQVNIPQENAEYIIKEGDTLFAIAESYGIPPEKIIEANTWLEGGVLTPGKTLVIPNQQQVNNQFTGVYPVQEGDTLSALAQKFGTTVESLMQLNALTDTNIFVGQNLIVPFPEPIEQPVEDLRGYLSVNLLRKSDGTTVKEYNLEVIQENGSIIYQMEGSALGELDAYNGLPTLITGTINTDGRLVVASYKIPYPDLHFQILKGTQRAEQIEGQNVIVFTAEDGTVYVEFLVTNTFPLTPDSFTGIAGDLIQQEVLVIPGETFGGLPVAHVYQSEVIQENGPELEVQANRIYAYDEPSNPGSPTDYTAPNLTIDKVELVYYGSNPYYQVNDPNYSQRSPHIQPVWHFHGFYEDGSEFDMLIQALKQEFLLPELAPGISPG
jgi:LysM repeat protein